ncbi:MAG: flippase-like domain-containing protein [Deltaproteobacteria bacterium]|nr:flippase-like domain-containing protein [Deltaproteobacteria bacterium]
MQKTTVNKIIVTAKLALGVVLLLSLLLWGDNFKELWKLLKSIKAQDVLMLCIVSLLLNWISCLKWSLFLKERGFHVSQLRLLGLYLVGKFFSNFVPTTVGGDLTRTFLLGRQINSQSQSFASVFLERITGLAALIVMAVFFLLLNPRLMQDPKISISILCFAVGFVLSIALMLNQRMVDWMAARSGKVPFLVVVLEKIKKVQRDILYFKGKYQLLTKALVYSFIFHMVSCLNVYVACLAVGVFPSFLDIAVVTPVILLLNILPVSPNNIGWWEWTFSFLLVEAGAGRTEGLAVGLILRAITLLFSVAGGVIFLFEKNRKGESAAGQACRVDS